MQATNFTRDDCQLKDKRVNYFTLTRDYRCQECGGAIVVKGHADESTGWMATCWAECGNCGGQDFIHARELTPTPKAVGVSAALESKPEEKREPVLFRLHSEPIDI